MVRAFLVIALLACNPAAGLPQGSSANPLSDGTRFTYNIMKSFLTRSAAKMPEENYSFRPTPEVRSFAEFIGHIADSNFRLCSVVAGDTPIDAGNERSKIAKTELVKALTDSFAYCDNVYNQLTDAGGTATIQLDAGVEGLRTSIQMPKLTALSFLTQANFEHYGNIGTYMRLKGLLPPSSELPPPRPFKTTAGSEKSYSNPAGEWNLLVETPNGPIAAMMTLQIQGNNLTGSIQFDKGTVALTGTLGSNEIRFSGKSQTLAVTFSGTPAADRMTGKVDFAGHPGGTWTASRP